MSDGKIMRRVLLIGGPAHGETRGVEYDSRHPAVHLDGVEYWRSGLIDNNAHIYYADAPVSSVASVASGPVTANDLFALGARALKSGQSPLASALVTLAAAMLGDKLDGMADAMFLRLTSADKRDRRNAWRREPPPRGVVEGWTPPEIREPSPLHRSADDCGSAPTEGDIEEMREAVAREDNRDFLRACEITGTFAGRRDKDPGYAGTPLERAAYEVANAASGQYDMRPALAEFRRLEREAHYEGLAATTSNLGHKG